MNVEINKILNLKNCVGLLSDFGGKLFVSYKK